MKFAETSIVFREFPNEVTLAINLTNCPNACPGCHSPWLQTDTGTELTETVLDSFLEKYAGQITCVGFMGGDNDVEELVRLMAWVRIQYPKLSIGWYSGRSDLKNSIDPETLQWIENCLDYVKVGPYIEALGPLDSPTTNQKLYKRTESGWEWIPMYK